MRGKVNKGRKVNYMEKRNKLNIGYRENALRMKREACMSHRRRKSLKGSESRS
jgi:hypothetical protein